MTPLTDQEIEELERLREEKGFWFLSAEFRTALPRLLAEVKESRRRLETLKLLDVATDKLNNLQTSTLESLSKQLADRNAAIKVMREALEFYQTPLNWVIPAGKGDSVDWLSATCAVQRDSGTRAFKAMNSPEVKKITQD